MVISSSSQGLGLAPVSGTGSVDQPHFDAARFFGRAAQRRLLGLAQQYDGAVGALRDQRHAHGDGALLGQLGVVRGIAAGVVEAGDHQLLARRVGQRLDRRRQVPNDRLHFAFRLPAEGPDEFLAASLALDCVAGLASSPMVSRLVRREQVATSIGSHAMGFIDGSSLGLIVTDVSPGEDTDRLESDIAAELARFVAEGPSEELLESVKAQGERAWLSSLASGEERADLISQYTLLHDDPGYLNTTLDRVLTITQDQVQEAATRWLQPENRVCVAYLAAEEDEDEEEAA